MHMIPLPNYFSLWLFTYCSMKVSLWTIKKLALPVARLGDNVVCFFFHSTTERVWPALSLKLEPEESSCCLRFWTDVMVTSQREKVQRVAVMALWSIVVDVSSLCQWVTVALPVLLFPFSTVEVLIAFYENRLKDHYVVTSSVLQGLGALVSAYLAPCVICVLHIFYL